MMSPRAYNPELAEQARRLCLMGLSDENIAYVLSVSLEDLAHWAWDHREFFDAITPSEQDRAAYNVKISARRDAKNRTKRARLRRNVSARIRNAISARLWAALRGRSDGKLFSRLGYTAAELRAHLESRFEPGMSWHNYGDWHVDHIKPCVLFAQTDAAQFAACWALSNLQPLWAADNMSKGAKYACA